MDLLKRVLSDDVSFNHNGRPDSLLDALVEVSFGSVSLRCKNSMLLCFFKYLFLNYWVIFLQDNAVVSFFSVCLNAGPDVVNILQC